MPALTDRLRRAALASTAAAASALPAAAQSVVSAPSADPQVNPFGLQSLPLPPMPTLADLDGDGDLDLFSGLYFCYFDNEYCDGGTDPVGYDDVLFYENVGTPLAPDFAAPVVNPFGISPPGGNNDPAFVDIDADGDLDLFLGNKNTVLYFYENVGTAAAPDFASPVINPFDIEFVADHPRPAAGDLDGDGDSDLLVTQEENGGTLLFENVGTPAAPAFADPIVNPPGAGSLPSTFPALADADGDGDADLIIGREDGILEFYENLTIPAKGDPPGAFAFGPAVPISGGLSGSGSARPAIGDLTGDGTPDLIVGLETGDWVFLDDALAPRVHGSLTPTGPTTFPASGGTLGYSVSVTNATSETARGQFQVIAVRPNGGEVRLRKKNLSLSPGQTFSRAYSQNVPGSVSAGTYTIRLDLDGVPTDSFAVVKQGASLTESLAAEAEDASVLLTWTGSGRYEVQRLVGEAGMFESLGTAEGEGTLRYRTPPLAAGAHRFRVRSLGEGADLWDEAAEAEVVVGLDGTHRMSPVSPNPFGASGATFTLAVAEGQPVEVGVYDALGREVARLHEGPLAATQAHRFSLDARGLAPGVYVVRVSGRDFVEARSVTLLR